MQGRKPHSGPIGRSQALLGALAVCCVLLLAVAASAQAATEAKKTGSGSHTTITITVDPGVEHDIQVSYDSDQTRYEISDIAPMGDENGCNYSADPDDEIVCPAASPVETIRVITGDQDDSISLDLDGGEVADIATGAGDDFVDGLDGHDTIDGGPGDDVISGNDGNDTLVGGTGDDVLDGGDNDDSLSGGDGDDALSGDAGADTLHGDAGRDLADYVSVKAPVTVDLDGNGDDGTEGEHDNVKPDVEDIRGGSGDDVLFGNDSSNTLSGGDGNDQLITRDAGPDSLFCGRGNDIAIVDPTDTVDKCEKVDVGEGKAQRSFKIVIASCPGKTKNPSTACVQVRCVEAVGKCSGKVSLEATVAGKPAKGKRRKRPKSVRVKIGSSAFSTAEGKTASITVKLSKQGKNLLAKKGNLSARATVAASDQGGIDEGDIGTVKLAAKVKAAKKRH